MLGWKNLWEEQKLDEERHASGSSDFEDDPLKQSQPLPKIFVLVSLSLKETKYNTNA